MIGLLVLALVASVGVVEGFQSCKNPLDIALVVEDTSALGDAEDTLKNFLASIVNYYAIGMNNSQIALELYNDQSSTVFDLNTYTQTNDIKAAVLGAPFTRKQATANVQAALDYCNNNVLTTEHGKRCCNPAVIILVSYSSIAGPNSAPYDVTAARNLQDAGANIIAIGVGPGRDAALLTKTAGSANNYFDFNKFSDLDDDSANKIAEQVCQYKMSHDFYPCNMESIIADIVFVVDVSESLNSALTQAAMEFMAKLLQPYPFGKNGVQASLVVYSKDADVPITLSSTKTFESFLQKVQSTLNSQERGAERFISNALDTTLHHALVEEAGFRPTAPHAIFILSTNCFTGPDPVSIADAIRNEKSTDIHLITLGQQGAFWKEALQVAGDPKHIYEVEDNPGTLLATILPKMFWRYLCNAGKDQMEHMIK